MILLISNKWDLSVDYVVRVLRARGEEFLRLNTEDLPGSACTVKFPGFAYTIGSDAGEVDLVGSLKSVWFRRPGKPFEDDTDENGVPPQVAGYVSEQWLSFVDGLLSIENVLWINEPGRNQDAECKILQLHKAQQLGLSVPRTCITSNKKEALEFYRQCEGRVVVKALYSPLLEYPDRDFFVFTTHLEEIDGVPENELSIAPTIFQERLVGKTDYRVTVVGRHYFAVKIEGEDDSSVALDWRTQKEGLLFTPCELPQRVARQCIELVRCLGLVFGAIDLAEVDGQFYFLEINPNGEWGWLQAEANLPIADTLVDYLIVGKGL